MMVPMGNQLAAGRRALGISQQSLAELAGCHRVMIARIESHNDQSGPAYPLARQAVRDVLERRGDDPAKLARHVTRPRRLGLGSDVGFTRRGARHLRMRR
jgi:predicted transcriptional regulator